MRPKPLWTTFRSLPSIVQFGAVLALVFLLLAILPAHADSIARQGSDWVRLTLQPCSGKAAEAVQKLGGDPLSFRAGAAHIGGQDYATCWAPGGAGAVIVYQDGDTGLIPLADLKPAPEA